MKIEVGDYLTRNGTQASVWDWGKNLLGEECWRGTVQGGGFNCWNREGQDLSGTTAWDIVTPISHEARRKEQH